MKSYCYKKIDAFTSNDSKGNPAAFIDLQNDQISKEEMLEIAKDHQGFVSEFVFVNRNNGKIKLTYYSSECEVSFCGHGTIATMYEIIKNDANLFSTPEFIINTNKKGELTVYNSIAKDNAVFIQAPEAIDLELNIKLKEIAQALEISESIISKTQNIDFIDAGLRTLIVPIINLSSEISIYPDKDNLKTFCINNKIDIILIFSEEVSDQINFAHTRVFAPKFGYLEDPATGSGNSAFGYYLIKNKMWKEGVISIEQGGNQIIFNIVKLAQLNNKVLFGGQAKKKIDGVYYLD